MENKLTLADICCYLPYGLKVEIDNETTSEVYKAGLNRIDTFQIEDLYYERVRPLLRPMSMLYQTIVHEGKEEVAIVELTKICFNTDEAVQNSQCGIWVDFSKPDRIKRYVLKWVDETFQAFVINDYPPFDHRTFSIFHVIEMFDYLHSRLFDIRGLIKKGLAIKMEG